MTNLRGGLIGFQKQSGSGLEESPQFDLVLPAHRELAVSQSEDLIDGSFTEQVILQLLCGNIKWGNVLTSQHIDQLIHYNVLCKSLVKFSEQFNIGEYIVFVLIMIKRTILHKNKNIICLCI